MNKKDLWQKFMKTGKVSDYLNYKNANEFIDELPVYDEEFAEEFAEEEQDDYDDESFGEENDHDYEDRWIGDT